MMKQTVSFVQTVKEYLNQENLCFCFRKELQDQVDLCHWGRPFSSAARNAYGIISQITICSTIHDAYHKLAT